MKQLIFLSLLVFSLSALSQDYYKLKVKNKQDIVKIHEAGFEIPDARVNVYKHSFYQTYKIRWIAENEFVTVKCDKNQFNKLRDLNFNIIEKLHYQKQTNTIHKIQTIPHQFGWPKTMAGWPTVYGQSSTIDDINYDGIPEIFLNNSEGYVYMWKPNGAYVLGYPKSPYQRYVGTDPSTGDSVFTSWVSTGSRETTASGDINGDGQKEFVYGKDIGYIFAYHYHYHPPTEFPIELPFLTFSNDPAVYDVDNDGDDEIIIVTYPDDYYYPNEPSQLHIYNADGSEPAGWPQTLPVESESSPAIGDIDGDGEMEIVVGSGKNTDAGIPGQIFAFELDGSVCQGFPFYVGYGVESVPSIADIDGDKTDDVLIRIKIDTVGINGVYAISGSGQVLPGFPAVITSGGTPGAPAIADIDGDGLPEIAIGTIEAVDLGKIWVWEHDGTLKNGFPAPVNATWVEESVALADVSGDSLPDIICGTNGVSNDPAKVWAVDYNGMVVNGFPITINETFSSLESAPSVVDIDGDGDLEVFTASHGGTVYSFDTDGKPSKTDDWPMYKNNPARTGSRENKSTGIIRIPHSNPVQFSIDPAYPNPFNEQVNFRFSLKKHGKINIAVFNTAGQQIGMIDTGAKTPGIYKISWNAGDFASGIYFLRFAFQSVEGQNISHIQKIVLIK